MGNQNGSQASLSIQPFYVETLFIDPQKNQILDGEHKQEVQPKVMEVLCYLSLRAHQLVTVDDLISDCWSSQLVSDGPVHKCIAQLRKVLSDSSKSPRFIKTVVKKGYVFIAEVRGLVTTSPASSAWHGKNPYPGEQAYTSDLKDVFCGREQLAADISQWLSQLQESDVSWLMVEGPPREGKTSLINAAILPNLPACQMLDPTATVARFDLRNLHVGQHLGHQLLLCLEAEGIVDAPDLTTNLRGSPSRRTLVFIDHLEQAVDWQEGREDFFTCLRKLIESRCCLVIVAADERHRHRILALTQSDVTASIFKLAQFSAQELADIVQKPANLAGLRYEYSESTRQRLDFEICKELQLSSVPVFLLQRFLHWLCEHQKHNKITFDVYRQSNGLIGNLVSQVDEAFQSFEEHEREQFDKVLYSLLSINSEGKVESQMVKIPLAAIDVSEHQKVIEKSVQAGIVKYALDEEDLYFFLVHEGLIEHWKVIKSWVSRHIDRLYVRHDLYVFTGRWLHHHKHPQYLLPSSVKLKQIQALKSSGDFNFSDDDIEFVKASENRLRRSTRLKNMVMGVMAVSFISLALLTWQLDDRNRQLNATQASAEELISFILYDLKGKLEPLGKLELLDLVATKTLDYFTLDGAENLTGSNLYRWVSALQLLGQVDVSKHQYQDARNYFRRTEAALQKDMANGETEKALELSMFNHYWLGYIAFLEDDYQTAEPYFVAYYEGATKLNAQFPSENWQLERSYALNNLGALAEQKGALSKAGEYYEQSYQLKLALLVNQPDNLTLRQDLADTRSWQSNLEQKAGRLDTAISYLQDALAQIERDPQDLDNKSLLEQRAILHHTLALYYFDRVAPDSALEHVATTQGVVRELMDNDQSNLFYVRDMIWSQLLEAKLHIHKRAYDNALVALDSVNEVISTFEQQASGTATANRARVWTKILRAQVLYALKQYLSAKNTIEGGRALFDAALDHQQQIKLFANLVITQELVKGEGDKPASTMSSELSILREQIRESMSTDNPDFETVFLFLTVNTLMGENGEHGHFLDLYKASDYQTRHYLDFRIF